VAKGQSCRAVAGTFEGERGERGEVVATVPGVWKRCSQADGWPASLRAGGGAELGAGPDREAPDLTLRGLAAELAERGIAVSHYAVWHFLIREGITFKKRLRASEQDRPDVARRRARWTLPRPA
jgi:transposase